VENGQAPYVKIVLTQYCLKVTPPLQKCYNFMSMFVLIL